ncbi:MAG: trypsin-like serine protease [Clostridiales bacterium]|nr:trypsin-like serine protease [Clostridiales bacterium]
MYNNENNNEDNHENNYQNNSQIENSNEDEGNESEYFTPVYSSENVDREKKKKGGFGKKIKFMFKGLAFGVFAAAAFIAVNYAAGKINPELDYSYNEAETVKQVAVTASVDNPISSGAIVTDVADVVDEAMPSIVSVVSTLSSEINYGPFSLGTQEYDASGSGIIIGQNDKELLIATNNHVVEGSKAISVTFIDEVSVEAVIKGTESSEDLAVIAVPLENISAETFAQIKIASLGDSDELKVGEGAIAIGNALGYGQSVTTGVISALNREVSVGNLTLNMIQTDAAINQGNSGGALLNLQGEVIGINSAKYSATGVESMGYAIPISSAMEIINELMNRQTRTLVDAASQAYLGIAGVSITEQDAVNFGAPTGAIIQQILEDGPAEKAGLKKYDIITKLDGRTISSFEDLKAILQYYEAGETVTVVVSYIENHEYVDREVAITLGAASDYK